MARDQAHLCRGDIRKKSATFGFIQKRPDLGPVRFHRLGLTRFHPAQAQQAIIFGARPRQPPPNTIITLHVEIHP